MEYAEGGDLLQYVMNRESLNEKESKHIFLQLVDAIKQCHSKGILHRDIKLNNVLLDGKTVKLCDFGSSKLIQSDTVVTELTGTPSFLAPEVINKY